MRAHPSLSHTHTYIHTHTHTSTHTDTKTSTKGQVQGAQGNVATEKKTTSNILVTSDT